MGKLEYLDALKRAMSGLPPEKQAKTLAFYEQRFVDEVAAGRTEAAVAHELGDPKQIAMTLRASTHLSAFEQTSKPAAFIRTLVAALGLAIFNLFMLVPALVCAALLLAMLLFSMIPYVSGIVITASGLSGANELVLEGPFHRFVDIGEAQAEPEQAKTTVWISARGIRISPNRIRPEDDARGTRRAMRRAELIAGRGVRISTDVDPDSRTAQTLLGIGMVLGGILLFLLTMVASMYAAIGVKRYVQINLAVLRGH